MLASLALLILAAAQPDQVPPTPPQKPKLICREEEAPQVGSHIRTGRRCKTAEDWQVEDQLKDTGPATLKVIPGKSEGVPQLQRPPL